MINKFTNIHKANNYLSPQITGRKNHWNPAPSLGQAQICGGVKLANEIPNLIVIVDIVNFIHLNSKILVHLDLVSYYLNLAIIASLNLIHYFEIGCTSLSFSPLYTDYANWTYFD